MTDPWATPDPSANGGWYGPPSGGGWGPPPVPPTRRSPWVVPVAIVGALVLVAVAIIALTATAHPVRHPLVELTAPAPTRTTAPRRPVASKPAPPATRPTPRAVRTYSAPPDGVPVSGRVLDDAGRPAPGVGVTMTRHEGFFESLGRTLAAVGTLGLACLGEDVCTVPYGEAVTDPAGRFTLYLKHDVDDYDVVAAHGTETFSVKVDFSGRAMRLPDIRLWSPRPRLERSGTTARIRFDTAPTSLGSVDHYDASVTPNGTDDPALVLVDHVRDGATFDVRRIEDVRAALWVKATVRTPLGKATYAAQVPVGAGQRPMSRGMTCVEYGNGQPVRTRSCGLTDGDLVDTWHSTSYATLCKGGGSCDPSVAVDLGGSRAIHYVSVQGCDSFFAEVQGSVDGKTWRTLIPKGDPSEGCYGAVSGAARYVRVTGAFYTTRREIAVF